MTITLNTNTEKHHQSFQANAQTRVAFHHVHKSFVVNQQPVKVIHDFNLEIKEGEFIAIVGSSGCGKSTLLRLLAGLDQDFDGRILIDGADVSGIGGDRAVVFQEHRLFPWLTVEQNIELGLLNEVLTARDKDILVQKAIELIGLNGFEKASFKISSPRFATVNTVLIKTSPQVQTLNCVKSLSIVKPDQ